jgi:protein tyrosine/serine phosphatase
VGLAAAGLVPQAAGVPNFHQVDTHVYRGGQPSKRGLESLARLGIKTIVDLREGGARSSAERQAVEALGMRYVSIPMRGMRAPADDQIAHALAVLDTPGSSNWPVFVHCKRGADRTGTVIACYRISHDHWTNSKALKEAKLYGMHWAERAMREYILHYKPSGAPPAGERGLGSN